MKLAVRGGVQNVSNAVWPRQSKMGLARHSKV